MKFFPINSKKGQTNKNKIHKPIAVQLLLIRSSTPRLKNMHCTLFNMLSVMLTCNFSLNIRFSLLEKCICRVETNTITKQRTHFELFAVQGSLIRSSAIRIRSVVHHRLTNRAILEVQYKSEMRHNYLYTVFHM